MNKILSSRARFCRVVAPVVGVVTLAGGLQFAAPFPAAGQDSTSPPTTKNPLEQLLENLLPPPSTTAPPAPPAPVPPGEPSAPAPEGPDAAAGAGDGTDPNQPGVVPPDAQALIDSIQRTGGRSTTELMAMLRQLEQVGYTEAEAAMMGMGHLPVAGDAAWSDDFLNPRFDPTFHLHQGNDIFAARGVPVRAPNDGTVRFSEDPSGGKAAYLTLPDRTYYYMAHLDGYADIPSGSQVTQGQIIGYNGDTGNAVGGSPHVHFEIHPQGGAAVNPKPTLDGWLDEAMAAAPALLASFRINLPQALVSTGQLRRFDQFEPLNPGADIDTLLWASSQGPPGGAMRLAELRAAGAASNIDWENAASNQHATIDDWQKAQDLSRAILSPVTPPLVERMLSAHAH